MRRLSALRRLELVPTEEVVYRLLHRGEHIDAVATPRARPSSPGYFERDRPGRPHRPTSPVRPVARVVRRPAALTIAEERAPAAEAPKAVRTPRTEAADGVRQADSGPVDLNQLTDQVVQAIDRRIIAQRERLGRI